MVQAKQFNYLKIMSIFLVLNILIIYTLNSLTWGPFEFGIYISYALSLVQDFDLNIINNLCNYSHPYFKKSPTMAKFIA